MSGDDGNRRPHLVILGGGFGGAYCAQALDRAVRLSDELAAAAKVGESAAEALEKMRELIRAARSEKGEG